MKNLGKIVFLLISLYSIVWGSVEAKVDKKEVMIGDIVTFRIDIFGDDIEEPSVDSLCGYDVESSSIQRSIQMIGTSVTKNYTLIYTFEPEKSCVIKPISIKVDGKIEKTKPIKITVTNTPPQTQDKSFILELRSDKKEVFVGESFNLELTFKQKKGAEAIDSKFYPPKLDGFWIKYQSEPRKTEDKDYVITKIDYKMAAQREGELEITPAKIKIASRDKKANYWNSFAPSIKWKTYYSNSLKIKVNPLPTGLDLVGNFDIEASVDKKSVFPNEVVTLTITIKGDGNIEDIKEFNPYIPDVNVFTQKPKIDQKNSIFTQKITFVSDVSYTIPSFKIRYFDAKTKKIEQKQTAPIDITVKGAKKTKDNLVIKKSQESKQSQNNVTIYKSSKNSIETSFAITWMVLSFIAGVFVGAIFVYFVFIKAKQKNKKRKFGYKDYKELFVKLLPYKDDKEVKEILDKLESAMYGSKNVEIDIKKIKEIVKKYNIAMYK